MWVNCDLYVLNSTIIIAQLCIHQLLYIYIYINYEFMSLQHCEFITRLRDAERLRLYVESGLSAQENLDASLKEA